MKVLSVSFHGVPGLPDGQFDLSRNGEPADLVLVTGPPASGKTAFLEAIAEAKESIAAYGGRPGRRMTRLDRKTSKVTIEWWLDEEERAIAGGGARRPSEALFGAVDAGPDTAWDEGLRMVLGRWSVEGPKVEYFHAMRRMPSPPFPSSARVSATAQLTATDAKFEGLHGALVESALGIAAETQPPTHARRFERAFEALCRTKRFRGVARRPEGSYAAFDRAAGGPWVALHELSASEHQAALFAAAFSLLRIDRSTVLIDTPELAQPPELAEELLRGLASLGRNQLIVATTSQEILARADRTTTTVLQLRGA